MFDLQKCGFDVTFWRVTPKIVISTLSKQSCKQVATFQLIPGNAQEQGAWKIKCGLRVWATAHHPPPVERPRVQGRLRQGDRQSSISCDCLWGDRRSSCEVPSRATTGRPLGDNWRPRATGGLEVAGGECTRAPALDFGSFHANFWSPSYSNSIFPPSSNSSFPIYSNFSFSSFLKFIIPPLSSNFLTIASIVKLRFF